MLRDSRSCPVSVCWRSQTPLPEWMAGFSAGCRKRPLVVRHGFYLTASMACLGHPPQFWQANTYLARATVVRLRLVNCPGWGMVDAAIAGAGLRSVLGQTTRTARGAGRATFGLVAAIALGLKLYEYGTANDWAFIDDVTAIIEGRISDLHFDQWVPVAIILLEAGATAAVISIAVTYVVVNQFSNTTNVTNIASSEELGRVIMAIDRNLTELHSKAETFETHLKQSQDNERERMLEFLRLAESDRNKLQAERLEDDKKRFNEIKDGLKAVVDVLNRPPGP